MPSIQRACLCRSRSSSRALVRSSWTPTLCSHGTLCKGQVELCLVSGWRDPEKCAPPSRCRQSPGAGRCQEGRHSCPEVRGPPEVRLQGAGRTPSGSGAELRVKRQIPCQPGLFSHIHTPGCLKVTCNQTLTGQELPFVLFGDQIRSDKEQ